MRARASQQMTTLYSMTHLLVQFLKFREEIDALRVASFLCPPLGSLSFLRVTTIAIAGAREMLRDIPLSKDARTAERADGHKILRDACIREIDDVAVRSRIKLTQVHSSPDRPMK